MRSAILFSILLLSPGLVLAAMPDTLQQKAEALAKESDGLLLQRHKWEGVQKALLAQKKQIEDTQKAVMGQEDALNQRSVSHNQQIAAQQAALNSNKSGCNNGGDNSSGHTNDCDNDIKSLNSKTGDLNADTTTLQSDQAKLDAQYAKANQDASDWNAHESVATEHLNAVYRATNDWLDRAYAVIIDGDFRDAVTAAGADAACENRGLPAEKLRIPTLVRLSDAYRKCLKTVLSATQAAPAPATHPGA
jgi:chromosome segregation ATPase